MHTLTRACFLVRLQVRSGPVQLASTNSPSVAGTNVEGQAAPHATTQTDANRQQEQPAQAQIPHPRAYAGPTAFLQKPEWQTEPLTRINDESHAATSVRQAS